MTSIQLYGLKTPLGRRPCGPSAPRPIRWRLDGAVRCHDPFARVPVARRHRIAEQALELLPGAPGRPARRRATLYTSLLTQASRHASSRAHVREREPVNVGRCERDAALVGVLPRRLAERRPKARRCRPGIGRTKTGSSRPIISAIRRRVDSATRSGVVAQSNETLPVTSATRGRRHPQR